MLADLMLLLGGLGLFLLGMVVMTDGLQGLAGDYLHQLLARFTSVTRATIKGTIVICILQGGLAGLGFFMVGIKGAAFCPRALSGR